MTINICHTLERFERLRTGEPWLIKPGGNWRFQIMSRKRDIRNQHELNPTKQQLCNGRIAIHLHNMSQEFLSIIPLHKNYDYPEYLPVISWLWVQMDTYIVILDDFSMPFINGNCCNTLFIQIRKIKILTKACPSFIPMLNHSFSPYRSLNVMLVYQLGSADD